MLEMVRQQMICIIAPDWPGAADLPGSDGVSKALDKLLSDVGVVHFASIALLPAISHAKDQLPSLMLELAVDEGLRPYDLLVRLVNDPSDTLWSLYSVYWLKQPVLAASQRKQELLVRLMSWHHIADGAFVGARDRTVRQIKMERELLEQTRAAARGLKAKHGESRTSFALALARWAFGNPCLDWATEPAPRSFWRGSGASMIAKVAYPTLIVGLWLAFLWLVGALSRLVARADAWFFERSHSAAQAVSHMASETSGRLLEVSGRFLLALAALAFAFWVFFIALPALFAPWRRWLDSLRRELDRPSETWSSLSTYISVWLVGVPLALASAWYVVIYTFKPDHLLEYTNELWMPVAPGWKHLVIGACAILVLLGLGALFSRLDRLLPAINAGFFRPLEDDVERAQQVHPSIEDREAQLVGGTAHMISLTDMRSPRWWSVWWTRAVLRLVTFGGRVFFTESRLSDAPGIHFGHWHIIDNGRRYLFCANYDGNFGGYLDDFINGASAGTTLFWRWTKLKGRVPAADGQPGVALPRAFPPTRFLAFRGVKCELKFKSYARDSMLPHLYRFDACNLSMDEINRATALRDALFGERNDSNDDQIMRAIES
jgi:hypothetical protein